MRNLSDEISRRITRLCMAWLALTLLLLPARPAHAAVQAPSFQEVFRIAAFSVEYGDGGDVLHRWESPLLLYVHGSPTPEDEETIDAFMQQLNENVAGFPGISRTLDQSLANVTVAYVPLEQMQYHVTDYREGNWGYVSYFWNAENQMFCLEIAIASDKTNQKERNHLFMEELVGGLGLTNDIEGHPDSIIYQPWTDTQQLSRMDWQLLNLLYDKRLQSGMTWQQAKKALGW